MNASRSIQSSFTKSLTLLKTRKDMLYMIVFILALVAFEAFNYSTTDFALSDLLGDLHFAGIRWATLLTIAFCGIDFAGVAKLFSPQDSKEDSRTMWFMFSAWILAATMNALLTWWGVVMAMQMHPVLSANIVDATFITRVVPIFIALMVWVIRILLVATLSIKSERMMPETPKTGTPVLSRREFRQAQSRSAHPAQASASTPFSFSKAAQSKAKVAQHGYRPEPKYIPMQDEAVYHALKATGSGQRRA